MKHVYFECTITWCADITDGMLGEFPDGSLVPGNPDDYVAERLENLGYEIDSGAVTITEVRESQ